MITRQDGLEPDITPALRANGGFGVPGARDTVALDQLLPEVYRELCVIAHRHLARGVPGATLATTELVHEVYLKLGDQSGAQWHDRAHFFALASVAMRHILVDRARARSALKRGGTRRTITLDEDVIAAADQADSLLEINGALDELATVDARLARVVECRFFGGMSEDEIALALGVTVRTVQRDWAKARMLLRRTLGN